MSSFLRVIVFSGIAAGLLAAPAGGAQGKVFKEGDSVIFPPDVTDEALQSFTPDPAILRIGFSVGPNRWKTQVTARGLETLARWTHLHGLGLPQQAVTDDLLLKLAPLKSLTYLHLADLSSQPSPITAKGLAVLESFPQLRELWLDGIPLTDEATIPIGKLNELRVLRFFKAPITDAGVQNLSRLTLLEDLQLGQSKVTDKALAVIGTMTHLQTLDLRAPVTGNGLRALSGLKELQWLALGNNVDDATGSALAPLKNLESLYLNDAQITDSGARDLAALRSLKTLELNGTRVTDRGVELLSSLSHLEDLGLSRTGITDRTLEFLTVRPEIFPSLVRLQLEDVRITLDAVARLKQARPKLNLWVSLR